MKKDCYNESKPLFFLFTCVKDGRKYISKLFDSLLSQTKFNFVHYIYEDGSSDPIDDLVDEYMKKATFKVVYERNIKNIGLNMATKHCISMCNLPYFIWIDCDNYVDSHFFDKLEESVLKHKKSILIRTKCIRSNGYKNVKETFAFKHRHKKNQRKYFLYGSFCYGFFAVNNEMYSRLNADNFFFDKRDYFNDDQIISLTLFSGGKISFCDEAIGYFLVHDENESLVNRSDSALNEYSNYAMTAKRFGFSSPEKVLGMFYLKETFIKMKRSILNDNSLSWKVYFERLSFAKKNKIEKCLWFKTGNRFSWFIKLFIYSFISFFKRVCIVLKKAKIKLAIQLKWIGFKLFCFKPNVMSAEETIDLVVKNNLSISRFGDGEFRLMTKTGYIQFQSPNFRLSDELVKCFNLRNDKLLICSYNFSKKRPMNNEYGRWLKRFVYKHYKPLVSLFDKRYYYGDTDLTRFYHPYLYNTYDFDYLEKVYIPLIKRLWDGRNILIVEGEQTKLGVGNDLFNNAKTLRRIICPSKNAFNQYDAIYNAIINHYHKNDLIIFALGPTATVLSANVTVKHNYQCLDLGHIDVVYFWFKNRAKTLDSISGKFVNEADSQSVIKCFENSRQYKKQIICTINYFEKGGLVDE